MAPGMIETADTPKEARRLQTQWAEEVVIAGLASDYGVNVRPIRLGRQAACWGIFIEPHGDDEDRREAG